MKTLITSIALLFASITTAQEATGCINYSEQIKGKTVYLASICYKNSSKEEIRELFKKGGVQALLDAGHKVADQAQLDAMTAAANTTDRGRGNSRPKIKVTVSGDQAPTRRPYVHDKVITPEMAFEIHCKSQGIPGVC